MINGGERNKGTERAVGVGEGSTGRTAMTNNGKRNEGMG